jgi:hypothetical protein
MDERLEQEVRTRAGGRCEYCRLPETVTRLRFVLDHIIAKQHGGSDAGENLALSCPFCNRHKGPNVAGIDPTSLTLAPLFNPRTDNWHEHFEWRGGWVAGKTASGRATVVVLAMNHSAQVAVRQALMTEGAMQAD